MEDIWNDLSEGSRKLKAQEAEIDRLMAAATAQLTSAIKEKDAEITRLKELIRRAANALDNGELSIFKEMREAAK